MYKIASVTFFNIIYRDRSLSSFVGDEFIPFAIFTCGWFSERQLTYSFLFEIFVPQAYHPLFVLRTCASWILMAASVVYKGFCEYDD